MDPEIEKQGQEALARINTHINNLYWNARMEVKHDFMKARSYLNTLFVPENYGIEPTPEVKIEGVISFPDTFTEFMQQKAG